MAARWFEIPGIRSWRRGKRESGHRTPEGNGAAPDPGDADLTAVLDRWDRRLAREEKEQRSVEDRKVRFQEEAHRRLASTVGPTLEEIGREVTDRGHRWVLEERVDIQGQPAMACMFRPGPASGKDAATADRGGRASELCFRFQFPDRVAVTGAVASNSGFDDLPARSYPVDELDPALIKKEVTRLIAASLGES